MYTHIIYFLQCLVGIYRYIILVCIFVYSQQCMRCILQVYEPREHDILKQLARTKLLFNSVLFVKYIIVAENKYTKRSINVQWPTIMIIICLLIMLSYHLYIEWCACVRHERGMPISRYIYSHYVYSFFFNILKYTYN